MKRYNLNSQIVVLFVLFFLGTPFLSNAQKTSEVYVNSDIHTSRQNAITIASEKARPAVVGINVTAIEQVYSRSPYSMDPFFSYFFGDTYQKSYRKVHGLGSGFIISPDGYIITNHHVAGNAKEIVVTLVSGEKYKAKIIGSDMTSDIALLKIDAKNLPFIKFANSDELLIGEWVIAMGNPFGLFDINSKPTVTVGVVSNIDINMINEDSPFNRVYRGMIQTDAAISSGNSGGPLLNANGDVVGMNTVIYSTSQNSEGSGSIGIGFAIPTNRIKQIIDLLKTGKEIDRYTYLGMEADEITDRAVKAYGLDKTEGLFVTRIFRNSPAEKAGFELGDILLSINDLKIFRPEDFYISFFDSKVGDKLNFEISRNGKIIKKDVILESLKR
jgi:serine protease Do